jgi:lipopolysaccharide export LptBFGC system permease protein LptF
VALWGRPWTAIPQLVIFGATLAICTVRLVRRRRTIWIALGGLILAALVFWMVELQVWWALPCPGICTS